MPAPRVHGRRVDARSVVSSCVAHSGLLLLHSSAPVKRYSPVRKSGDHRSIGTHNDTSDNERNIPNSRLSNKYT